MRALPVRRIATTTLCATLLLGTAGPALASADSASREETRTAPRAPVMTPKAMLAEAKRLQDAGGVITPAADLLVAVLEAEGYRLSAAEAAKHAQAVRTEARKVSARQPAAPAAAPAARAPEPPAGSLPALQKTVDNMLKATTTGDATGVVREGRSLVTGLLQGVLGGLGGAAQPAPAPAAAPAAGPQQTPAT
ncbi:hypothetical protein DCW30_10035 [Streptomyces alfalfae]|uniref:Secreted protein n=1 Tax=Streptomyces alfalfae TaxID=1642299 RepID=A0A1P8THT1_9ACTN|nr:MULTISPECIES: hypothetical protein [Streptomyces]AYA17597.1 hypothetical protein D3X13_16285 [Streptomyces fradiae]APY87196.1 hypothetical protein A7J05_16950 [Streptomyces alfalfae]KUL55082.1 hypothetical protein ADL30_14680 [Streptomyces sp. NRRL S-1521]QQC90510.1 hypothetical protein I8755_20435 [Streptomyces alfalfae]QUI32989.1 hypothetical protein H9W91_20620 [Streptomyces alfalfae]